MRRLAPIGLTLLALNGCVATTGHGRVHFGHHGGGSVTGALIEVAADLILTAMRVSAESSREEEASSEESSTSYESPPPGFAPPPTPVPVEEPRPVSHGPGPTAPASGRSSIRNPPSAGTLESSAKIAGEYAERCRGASHGDANAVLVFSSAGSVKDVELSGPGIADPGVADCARSRLLMAKVVPYDGDDVRVTVGFHVE